MYEEEEKNERASNIWEYIQCEKVIQWSLIYTEYYRDIKILIENKNEPWNF